MFYYATLDPGSQDTKERLPTLSEKAGEHLLDFGRRSVQNCWSTEVFAKHLQESHRQQIKKPDFFNSPESNKNFAC